MSDLATAHYHKIMTLKARLKKRDDEIERLREALQSIEDLCDSEIKIRFMSSRMKEEEVAGSSKIYSMLSIPRNIARSALKGGSDD